MLFAGLTKQLAGLFKVRAGEERTVSLVLAMTSLVSAGGTVGGNAIEALFFSRQGTSALPALYIALGVSNFVVSLAITAGVGGAVPPPPLPSPPPLLSPPRPP